MKGRGSSPPDPIQKFTGAVTTSRVGCSWNDGAELRNVVSACSAWCHNPSCLVTLAVRGFPDQRLKLGRDYTGAIDPHTGLDEAFITNA